MFTKVYEHVLPFEFTCSFPFADVPDAPANVEVREVSSRTVRVSWSPPFTGNSPITQYTIHWKTPDDLWQDTTTISGLESKATVRGLMPTTTYQLRVRADNVFGSGPYSESIDFTTVEEPPRFPPKNVQVKASNSRTLSISFDNPHLEDTGDKIEGYYVGYRELGSLEAFTFKTFEVVREAFQQSTLTYEVASLRRSTEYAVTVQAFNGKGAGPQSEVVRVRTLDFDPPNAPHLRIAGTTSRSISVNWENEHIQEAPVTGYYLYYKYDNGEWQEVSVPHDRRAFTLTDLRCGTEYLLHMRASNRAGKGAQGETVSVKTNGGRPLEPDSNKLFEVNSTFVVLHLEAWDDGGCPIAYFVVQYRADGGASDWTLHSNNVVPQQQLVHLGDLVPGSWYTLLMSAHNDAGSTEVELSFATLTLSGDMPSRRSDVLDPQVAFYRHLTVTLPIVSSALVLVVVLGVVCLVLRKRTYDTRQRSVDGIVVSECCDAGKGDMMLAVSHESQGRNQEAVYYPAPYSTHRGHPPRCNGGGGGPRFEDTKARTYDVPYPVKRLEMWDPSPEASMTCMQVYERAGQEAMYRTSPYHISKQKDTMTTAWREDGDRSSCSENDTDELLEEASTPVEPQPLIVPLDRTTLDYRMHNGTTRSWKKYPSSYQTTSLRCAGEYTSIT